MNLLQILKTAGKRGWRVTDQSASIHSSRSLSITCRGKSISREELYTYSNGRFLVNEAHAFSRRHVRFDVDQLCNVAAAVGLASPIQSIEKMEGGFSKALLMRREDGSEMIAKIPFPIAGPSKYTTASEVAVLEYRKVLVVFMLVHGLIMWQYEHTLKFLSQRSSPGTQMHPILSAPNTSSWKKLLEYNCFENGVI